jgi:hypothetical protein
MKHRRGAHTLVNISIILPEGFLISGSCVVRQTPATGEHALGRTDAEMPVLNLCLPSLKPQLWLPFNRHQAIKRIPLLSLFSCSEQNQVDIEQPCLLADKVRSKRKRLGGHL